MSHVRLTLLVVGFGAAAWCGLETLRPKARWLVLACPPIAVPGRPLPIELRFPTPLPPGRLSVDLHVRDPVGGGNAVAGVLQTNLNSHPGTLRVEVPVRLATTSGTVRAVVYLSPNGAWQDRTHAAITEGIPFRASLTPEPGYSGRLVRRPLFKLDWPSNPTRVRILPLRAATAILWLIAATAALLPRHPSYRFLSDSGASVAGPETGLRFLALGCALASVVEATDLTRYLGEEARSLARRFAAYDGREPIQQWVSAAVIGLILATGIVVARRRGPWPASVAFAATTAALGLLVLDSLSLHAFDELAESLRAGVPVLQWASLACALAVTAATVAHGPREAE